MTNPGDHGEEPKSEGQPSHEPQPPSTPPGAPGASGYPPSSPPPHGGYQPPQGGYQPPQGGYPPPQGGYPPPQGHPIEDMPPGGYPPPGYDPSGYGAPSYPAQPQYGAPAGGYPPQPSYSSGYDPYSGGYAAPQQGTNTMAIGSLIASIVSLPLMFLCFTGDLAALVGIVLGIVALNQIKQSPQSGRGMAIAGIVIGGVTLFLSVVIVAVARHSVWTSYQ